MPDATMADAAPAPAILKVNEDTHDFHDVPMGTESFPTQFIVTNEGQLPSGSITVSITGTNMTSFIIVPTGDGTDCAGQQLGAGTTCIIQVKYRAGSAGAESAALHVDADPGGMKVVGLAGNSIVPGSLEVTAGSALDFSDVRIQSSSTAQTITIHNKGGVTVTNVVVTLNDTTNFTKTSSTCGTTLAGNASCDINVRFNPTSVGTHPSSVTVTSDQGAVAPQINGTGTSDVTVSKSGTGSVADTLATPIISCGATCTGSYGQTPITLHASTSGGIPFNNWGGACASAGANPNCTLSLTQPTNAVSATFGVCVPGTGMCTNGSLQTCDSTGHWSAPTTCALGCYTDGTRCWDVDPSNGLAVALDDARTQADVSLTDGAQFDTHTGLVVNGNGNPVTVKSVVVTQPSGYPAIRVFEVGSLTMGSALVIGDDAFAIVADRDISISGVITLDTPIDQSAPGAFGAFGSSCAGASVSVSTRYPGSGGGSFSVLLPGARGGNNPPNNGGAAGTAANRTLVPLAGGCAGGLITFAGAKGGTGGGAVQIVSRTLIKVTGNGVINAGGGGAPGATGNDVGGGGGGSGGGVLLEAPSVTLIGSSAGIAVNGGGGSANCSTGQGDDGKASIAVASGGKCTGATITNGGDGATGTSAATAGKDFVTGADVNHAGGGGGGLGRIQVDTASNGFTATNGAFTSGDFSTAPIGKR
jgi:hypothetical protein